MIMEHLFRIDDQVQIRPGVLHPVLFTPLDGWHGRIDDTLTLPDTQETYLAVAWDSHTLQASPMALHHYLFLHHLEWRGWVFTPDQLQPFRPSATQTRPATTTVPADLIKTRQDILSPLKLIPFFPGPGGPDHFASRLNLTEDADWLEVDTHEAGDPFELDAFCLALDIPEREALQEALALGCGQYYQQQYGRYIFGKRPYFLIPRLMSSPYTFGYGVQAALADTALSLRTRQKLATFACQLLEPFNPHSIAYGLVNCLAFLAHTGILEADLLRSVFLALHLLHAKDPLEGLTLHTAQQLTDWLITNPQISEAEKLWWLWYWSEKLPPARKLGPKLAAIWLAHPGLSVNGRLELAWGWVSDHELVGQMPLSWQMTAAALFAQQPHTEPENPYHDTWAMVEGANIDSVQLRQAFLGHVMAPDSLRRYALTALAHLGESPLSLCQIVFAGEYNDYTHPLFMGTADLIRAYAYQMSLTEIQELVDMALSIGNSPLRREFYEIGLRYVGPIYRQWAQQDAAASIRKWAAPQDE